MNIGPPTVKTRSHGARQADCVQTTLCCSSRAFQLERGSEGLVVRSHEGEQDALPMEVRAGGAVNLA